MELFLTDPNLYHRDCQECRLYELSSDGMIATRGDRKIERRGGPPCETDSCPKGHYTKPKILNERNWLAFMHYLQCKATGSHPDDPIVKRNAMIIHFAMKSHGAEM